MAGGTTGGKLNDEDKALVLHLDNADAVLESLLPELSFLTDYWGKEQEKKLGRLTLKRLLDDWNGRLGFRGSLTAKFFQSGNENYILGLMHVLSKEDQKSKEDQENDHYLKLIFTALLAQSIGKNVTVQKVDSGKFTALLKVAKENTINLALDDHFRGFKTEFLKAVQDHTSVAREASDEVQLLSQKVSHNKPRDSKERRKHLSQNWAAVTGQKSLDLSASMTKTGVGGGNNQTKSSTFSSAAPSSQAQSPALDFKKTVEKIRDALFEVDEMEWRGSVSTRQKKGTLERGAFSVSMLTIENQPANTLDFSLSYHPDNEPQIPSDESGELSSEQKSKILATAFYVAWKENGKTPFVLENISDSSLVEPILKNMAQAAAVDNLLKELKDCIGSVEVLNGSGESIKSEQADIDSVFNGVASPKKISRH